MVFLNDPGYYQRIVFSVFGIKRNSNVVGQTLILTLFIKKWADILLEEIDAFPKKCPFEMTHGVNETPVHKGINNWQRLIFWLRKQKSRPFLVPWNCPVIKTSNKDKFGGKKARLARDTTKGHQGRWKGWSSRHPVLWSRLPLYQYHCDTWLSPVFITQPLYTFHFDRLLMVKG